MKLNDAIDKIEEIDDPADVVIIPPNDGDNSDSESGDDDAANVNHLPASMLRTMTELVLPNAEQEEDVSCSTKKSKKQLRWDSCNEQMEVSIAHEEISDLAELLLGTPCEYFQLFFDETLFQFIHRESRRYSGVDFNMNELKAVFGVILASGIVSQPNRRDYWSSKAIKANQAISQSISSNKFEKIFSGLHFLDPDTKLNHDKFMKIRLLLTLLNRRFMRHMPKANMFSVDESMVPYYGRHNCKQFIRGKPIRFGFKVWALCTASGYACQLEPYPGRAEKKTDEYDLGSSSNVVYYFCKQLSEIQAINDSKVCVTMDNYFTSLHLLQRIRDDFGFCASGTIRRNRIISSPIEEKKHERGHSESFICDELGGIKVTSWTDNKQVIIASTDFGKNPVGKVKRYSRKERKQIQVDRPAAVAHYNSTMGGVDLLDANVAQCRTVVRGKKWYFPLFLYLVDIAVVNSWTLFKLNGNKMTLHNFRTEIAEQLLLRNEKKRKTILQRQSKVSEMSHLVSYVEKQQRCKQCQKKTSFVCKTCDLYLHPKDCFERFHL